VIEKGDKALMKSEMKMKYNMKMAWRLAACCLLLFALAGNALAQGQDKQFVIKKTKYNPAPGEADHYLAHVYNTTTNAWELQDATEFSPNCLWYSGREISLSGTNHNYYFIDDNNQYRFLSAPLVAEGSLGLSASQPPIYLLNNTDHNYYFYDWDYDNYPEGAGVARGHQYNGILSDDDCNYDWRDDQCWEVYWVECDGSNWSLSSQYAYDITQNAGRFHLVTVEPSPMEIVGTGGLDALASFAMDYPSNHSLTASFTGVLPFRYIPAYNKYDFNEVTVPAVPANPDANPPVDYVPPTITHHTFYYPHGSTNTDAPTFAQAEWSGSDPSQWTYRWSVSGEGAEYLTLTGGNTASPTLTYSTENTTGHKTATLTLTVTYLDGSTQTSSATVTVKTRCQHPSFSANVTYEGVIVSWTPTAESYTVSWKKADASEWSSHHVDDGDVTSYTIIGLEYETTYDYKVEASCDPTPLEQIPQFTTLNQPTAVVGGAVFGGGRMANVRGKTEVVIINTDSIGAVYGGNDIAGAVLGYDGETPGVYGSTIILGVPSNSTYSTTYNNGSASTKVRVGDVYGGGNGYYAYDGATFVPADDEEHTSFTVSPNGTVKAMTKSHTVGEVVWENTTGDDYIMVVPTITKTDIQMNTNAVKVDSIFGGAKNAFITNGNDNANGTSITVDGGTAFAVFGGNNFGGNQTAGKHHIVVNNTKNQTSGYPNGLGRSFGIGYVFGGGNKVVGLTTDITITGGMCDTVFAGGNAADVGDAHVLVNCPRTKTFTDAVSSWAEDNVGEINGSYEWNGMGIYNVRALFGGNNRADMDGLPVITLTRGSVGTVYGGGNSGQMLAKTPEETGNPIATDFGSNYIGDDPLPIFYSTHVVMDNANMLVDYLYGGCQMSNVAYSTWVEVKNGHVGTVYGGCNIGGDVGSTRLNFSDEVELTNEHKQAVQGATYVKASGGTIHGNLFAGGNGFYHCNDGVKYIEGLNFTPGQYHVGKIIPSHNETHVMVSKVDEDTFVTVKGNVYAGGNLAYVGFINATTDGRNFPTFRGFCTVQMDGGVVEGSVYGGGNRASVFGSNAVQVSGGSIGYIGDVLTDGALYGGNDQAGQVAQITNRVLPASYDVASDLQTDLKLIGVKTYVGITGKPRINTVYGGGNGAYTYTPEEYCDITDQPVQSNTFVDINLDATGGEQGGGYINEVYGGGNGVTVLDRITVLVNVVNMPTGEGAYDQVGTIFGGNNLGDLDILSDIIMLKGQVNTIYGGCNQGAMNGSLPYNGYTNLGSMVHLRNEYTPIGSDAHIATNAKVTGAVYGGCRMNGVANNTLVLVEGGEHPATFFGGSDISGIVGGTSQVIVTGGSTGKVFGGGNGTGSANPPYCSHTDVYALGGTCTNNVYGGGLAGPCGETHVTINEEGVVNGSVFGGGDAGVSGETHVNIINGTVRGSVFGGGNEAGLSTEDLDPDPTITQSFSGNSNIMMSGGFVGAGMYGGCNAEGEIGGDVSINLTGGTVGTAENRANIHGGGYGQPTTVSGDVLINFGEDLDGSHNENLNLYGDLYGGSALGSVNTNETNTTTIHIDNGTINGNVYGGGLGDAEDGTMGWTYGVVHVFVGGETNDSYFGKASFNGCSIFGCNNLNGSPQADVYVDVYQTDHEAGVNTVDDDGYAIYRVFGGGNQANYAPENSSSSSLKVANVHIHGCYNTIEEVYGGSNQANAISTRSVVDGGRFNYIFGGGNGLGGPADVGVDERIHSTFSQIKGGHVAFCFGGSNSQGNCINIVQSFETDNPPICNALEIDNIYNGGNFADQVGEMVLNFSCETPENYKKAYGGCRLGTVYGNITVNVYGGIIGTLFGGCQGEGGQTGIDHPSHVKKYDNDHYPTGHPELIGTGGNITVNLFGGTIGEVYGGCDINGNVEGRISINVYHIENNCGLFIGNIYGASNHTNYAPVNLAEGIVTPKVSVIKATVGGHNNDLEQTYTGNVFGGGNLGTVTSNPLVVVGENTNTKPVTIKGDVYGGGDHGEINGTTGVIVVPNSHTLTINAPESGSGNAFRVTDILGNTVTSGASIDEYSDLKLVAMPSVYGQRFTGWTIGGGANVIDNTLVSTTFIMGTTNASITAGFGEATTHTLTVVNNNPSSGNVSVIDPQGNTVNLNQGISEGAELTLVATPVTGYAFAGWTVEGENAGVITSLLSPTTTFVMGTGNARVRATFLPTHPLTINIVRPENSSVSVVVTDSQGNIINSGDSVREGAILNLVATHAQGCNFAGWSYTGQGSIIGNVSSSTTTFTMGTEEAIVTATFTAQ
jgi:hypothetical protein